MHLKQLVLVLLISSLSCNLVQTMTGEDDTFLPEETDVPGWRLSKPGAEYTAKDIESYLKDEDKAALYKTYGFKKLRAAEYKSFSTPEKTIKAEIFQMSSSLNAFGILTDEMPYDTGKSSLCDDSFSGAQGIFARKGHYYIRIGSFTQYNNALNDYKMFLNAVCDKIKTGAEPLPAELALFGRNDKLSIKYKIKGNTELQAIKNVFTKKMDFKGTPAIIFWGKRNSGYISLGEFSGLLKDKNKPFIISSAGKSQTAFYKTDDNEFIFVSVYKEWIFGVLDATDMAKGEEIIAYMFNEILNFSNKK